MTKPTADDGSQKSATLEPPANIAILGTGVMGSAMARRLLAAGYRLTVFNRTQAKAAPLIEAGASGAATAVDAVSDADAVITIVGLPADVRDLYLGSHGILAAAPATCLFIDMTTSEPGLAVEIHAQAEVRGQQALDAPVSGGDVGARDGTLSIMIGGDAEAVTRAEPLLAHLGTRRVHQGPPGSGQRAKLANQIVIASTIVGVMEALAYARRSGLDPMTLLESIGAGAAGSWTMTNLYPRAARGDFAPGFAIKHFRKDMAIADRDAASMGLSLRGLRLADALYEQVQGAGGGDLGTQALLELLEADRDA